MTRWVIGGIVALVLMLFSIPFGSDEAAESIHDSVETDAQEQTLEKEIPEETALVLPEPMPQLSPMSSQPHAAQAQTARPAPRPAPPVRDPTPSEVIDNILGQLEIASIGWSAPDRIRLNDTEQVELIIAVGNDGETRVLEDDLNDPTVQQILVSQVAEATLTGTGFEIIENTPSIQPISNSQLTKWSWTIKAVEKGEHKLNLSLNALIKIHDTERTRALETFSQDILVEVTFSAQVLTFIATYWQWFITAVLLPIFYFVYKQRKGKQDQQ